MAVLKNILKGLSGASVTGNVSREVHRLTLDSRKVTKGSLFAALRGTQTDGHRFIGQAVEQGAQVILCEALPDKLHKKVTYVQVKNAARALGQVAADFYGNPSRKLKLVGITGTNGKTTVTILMYNLLHAMGKKAGMISTIRYCVGAEERPATHTTPDAIALHAILLEMVEAGCTHCFMEVSSHAIAQERIAGLHFTGAVFTNITHEHLDYHPTFKDYLHTKKRLFDELPETAFALVNADDRNAKVICQNTSACTQQRFGLRAMADVKARVLENSFDGLLLDINGRQLHTRLIGYFNAYNLLAAYGTALLLDESEEEVMKALSTLRPAEGRFDHFASPGGVTGIVDYAHTPDALKQVLQTIRDIRKPDQQIITVVGCGGDRDKRKRPVMAKVAAAYSNKVVFTSDNPRSESPETIMDDMWKALDMQARADTLRIADRREGIRTACALAKPGDIVLVAGKGHEKYQEINGEKRPFDDKAVLKEAFNAMNNEKTMNT